LLMRFWKTRLPLLLLFYCQDHLHHHPTDPILIRPSLSPLQFSVSQLVVAPAKRISKQNCNMMSDLLGYNYCSLGVSNLTLTTCGGRWCSCRTGPPTASAT
jgi:hypothetical protein